jgi:hypothetical protein
MKKSTLKQLIKEVLDKNSSKPKGKDHINKLKEGDFMAVEFIDRMEGLANFKDLNIVKEKLKSLTKDWVEEGFEKKDIIKYLTNYVKSI